MNIRIFNHDYVIRRFEEPRQVRGYDYSPYSDFKVSIHVHPGSDQNQPNPEGQRRVKRLSGHGEIILRSADESTGKRGDLLWWYNNWYECTSCLKYDHTLLRHMNYEFVMVPPADGAGAVDLSPPNPTDELNNESADIPVDTVIMASSDDDSSDDDAADDTEAEDDTGADDSGTDTGDESGVEGDSDTGDTDGESTDSTESEDGGAGDATESGT